jgi:hypothetical protein
MASVIENIAAFDAMRAELESEHLGEWVVFHDQELAGLYPSMERAAEDAVRKFGRGPYLIRQVGAPPLTLPASVMYSVHAGG